MKKKSYFFGVTILVLSAAAYLSCGSPSNEPSAKLFTVDGNAKAYTMADLQTLEAMGLISDGTLINKCAVSPTGFKVYADTPPTPDPTPPPAPSGPGTGSGGACGGCCGGGKPTSWGCLKCCYRFEVADF